MKPLQVGNFWVRSKGMNTVDVVGTVCRYATSMPHTYKTNCEICETAWETASRVKILPVSNFGHDKPTASHRSGNRTVELTSRACLLSRRPAANLFSLTLAPWGSEYASGFKCLPIA